eukprot:g17386.t1
MHSSAFKPCQSSPAEPGDADVTRDHRESQREKAPPAVRRVLLSVGTVVTSRWRGGTSWLRGRIIHINRDGTFKIQYDHGEIEPNVPALNIRAVDLPAVPRRDKEEGYGPPPPPPPPRRETPRPPPRPKSVAPPNPDRNDRNDPPGAPVVSSGFGAPELRWVRRPCVYAEGVDLGKLTAQQRSLSSNLPELVVGRTAQPAAVWETLVPDKRFHATISREHLKVIARQGSQGAQASFSVACLSLNGVMLNGHFIGNDSGERPLQHGDALAFATMVDVMAPIENQSRKPFVVLQFEVLGPSPAAEALPTAYPSSPRLRSAPVKGPFDDLEDRKERCQAKTLTQGGITNPTAFLDDVMQELLHPPPGMVAGRWRTSPTAEGPPDALFCLELHGNELRPGLPAEARQLFFCCDSQARPSRLRVGRYYQRHLWENILSEEILTGGTLWAAMMAQDSTDGGEEVVVIQAAIRVCVWRWLLEEQERVGETEAPEEEEDAEERQEESREGKVQKERVSDVSENLKKGPGNMWTSEEIDETKHEAEEKASKDVHLKTSSSQKAKQSREMRQMAATFCSRRCALQSQIHAADQRAWKAEYQELSQ